jgi:type IV secretory pathway TraG/TraD family ATPase VirD4
LEAGLTKGHKNGLRIVAGLQSTSQLEHIYGHTMATTTRASSRNLAVLGGSRTDPQTARDMSESLRKHEVERPKFSVSRSADHRNTSDNMDRTVEDVVTAAQIQALPTLEGYVALASGNLPVPRVKVLYQRFHEQAIPFLEQDHPHQPTESISLSGVTPCTTDKRNSIFVTHPIPPTTQSKYQ